MWQEDLTGQVAAALDRDDLVLVRAPADQGDWATLVLPPRPVGSVLDLPVVQRTTWQHGRLFLTLTTTARGQVVADVLTGRNPPPPAPPPADSERARRSATLARAGGGVDLMPGRLYPVRRARARTAMLLRQGVDHGVLPAPEGPAGDVLPGVLAGIWRDLAHTRTEDARTRALLLALAAAHLARHRARLQDRGAPVVSNLRQITGAFTDWFAHSRSTPRGPITADAPIMDTYRLNLALACATGLVLRTGLRELGLTAPENL
ncbi:hypothetical protein [Pseudactinotalea sp. Z1732]|uniref:hypothetical protein n=1 Tax=Micrococcales TaxID=85006 RepID=UPI003C7B79DC